MGTHISIDKLIRKINCNIVILINIPRIEKHSLINILNVYPGFQLSSWITISTIGSGSKFYILTCNKLFNYMSTSVFKLAGINFIPRVIFR
ncbi:hypothetical protein ES708_08377 [subsurface metagenome]